MKITFAFFHLFGKCLNRKVFQGLIWDCVRSRSFSDFETANHFLDFRRGGVGDGHFRFGVFNFPGLVFDFFNEIEISIVEDGSALQFQTVGKYFCFFFITENNSTT